MLERLRLGPASIGELARRANISLPAVLKHVRVLEQARLLATEKRGRVRQCRLGPDRMDDATRWIEIHRAVWVRRLNRLQVFLDGWMRELR